MNYYNILALLQKSNTDFASECLAAMNYEPIIMISGELTVNEELIQIYRLRRDLQEIQRTKIILGYDLMINQLHLIPTGSLINFTTVYTIKDCYIITHSTNEVHNILMSFSANIYKQRGVLDSKLAHIDEYQFFIKSLKHDMTEFFNILDGY